MRSGFGSTRAVFDATAPDITNESRTGSPRTSFRVLFVTQSYYPFLERGGSAATVHALATHLAQRGHAVTVLTSDLGITKRSSPATSIRRISGGWQSEEDGVKTLYLSAFGGYRSLTWNPGIFSFCAARLNSFDLAHIFGTYDLLGPIVARACRQAAIPYFLEPMGMFRPIVRNLALKAIYRQLVGNRLVSGAAALVATSVREKRELVEEGISPAKIALRRNGIEAPPLTVTPGAFRRQWQIPDSALFVLFLGRIVSKKSPELLLRAFARWQSASAAAEGAVLAFVGPSESRTYLQKLKSEANRLGLGDSVRFSGALYDAAKWAALVDADIFVLPSQNENFGNAAAEAVACGTPVIVTDRCGIAPMIEGRAGLTIPHDCEALVGALNQLSDFGLRARMKLRCKEVARGLTWDQPLAEMEALYSQVLNHRHLNHGGDRQPGGDKSRRSAQPET